jgi:predicted dehydrogenase
MTQQQKIRVGIVGCGYQGGKMAQAIARTESLRVVACADPNQEAVARLAATGNLATAHASVDAMLDAADVDAVIVATSHDALAAASLKAIRAGKHVLAEKPIGVSEAEAVEIEATIARTQIIYMAGYSFRFFPAMRRVGELLKAGAVGDVQAVMGCIGGPALRSGWKADPAAGGGAMLFFGCHLIDQVLWFADDDPVEVYASVRHRADTRADETSAFEIQFAKGATAQCLVALSSDGLINQVDIYGDSGRINLRGAGMGAYEIAVSSKSLSTYADPTIIRPRTVDDRTDAMHVPQLEEFARAIIEQRQPSVTVGDGRRVLKVIDAVMKSDQTGEPVQIA